MHLLSRKHINVLRLFYDVLDVVILFCYLKHLHSMYGPYSNTVRLFAPVHIGDINLLESVQRRFTKRLSGMCGLSYLQRLQRIGMETLELRRLKTDLIMMFKFLNNVVDIDFSNFFSLSKVTNTRGHRFKLNKPLSRVNARLFSFSCRRIDCWNSLPDNLINSESIALFKSRLITVNLSKHLIVFF